MRIILAPDNVQISPCGTEIYETEDYSFNVIQKKNSVSAGTRSVKRGFSAVPLMRLIVFSDLTSIKGKKSVSELLTQYSE